jgi:hypothetical protein
MGWRKKFTNIRQPMLKLKTHSMNYFDSDMSNSTNTEDGNLYLRLRTMSHTIRAEDNSSTCTFTTGKSVTYTFTTGKSVTIIVCLHVLIARRILLILDMWIIFSEYRCLTR